MGLENFCKGVYFFILTILTIGSFTGILGLVLKYLLDLKLNEVLTWEYTTVLVALIASVAFLIFSIIVVFFDNKCLRSFVSIMYVVFDIVILAVGVFLIASQNSIPNLIEKIWKDSPKYDPIRNDQEKNWECCGWNASQLHCINGSYANITCYSQYEAKFGQKMIKYGWVCIALFFVLLIAIYYAFKLSCRSGSDENKKTKEQFNTPLTYGW